MRRASVLFAFALLISACESPVQYGLDENAANEIVTALERNKIAATKKREEGGGNEPTFTVMTNGEDVRRAIDLLRTQGLPRTKRNGLAETYGQPSLVPSATEERARFVRALGNDIERTLETLDGVVNARVHLVPPETDPLSSDSKPRVEAQAGVLLKIRFGYNFPLTEHDIQKLVSGAVAGLKTQNVSVVVTQQPDWASTGDTDLVSIGPIRLTPGSRAVLFSALLVVLGVVAVLALILLLMARRLAAAQRALSTRRA